MSPAQCNDGRESSGQFLEAQAISSSLDGRTKQNACGGSHLQLRTDSLACNSTLSMLRLYIHYYRILYCHITSDKQLSEPTQDFTLTNHLPLPL